jgi:hypothetical protein
MLPPSGEIVDANVLPLTGDAERLPWLKRATKFLVGSPVVGRSIAVTRLRLPAESKTARMFRLRPLYARRL